MRFSYRQGILIGLSVGAGFVLAQEIYNFLRFLPGNLDGIRQSVKELTTPKSHKDWDNCLKENSNRTENQFEIMFGPPSWKSEYEICESKGYKPYKEDTKEYLEKRKQDAKKRVDEWYNNTSAELVRSNDTCEIYLKKYKLEKVGTGYNYIRDGEIKTIKDERANKVVEWNFKHQDASGKNMSAKARCYISRENGGSIQIELVKQSTI